MSITRRRAIAGAGAAAGAAMLPRPGRAQSTGLVVGTWGGDYGALLQSMIDEPLMRPLGIVVTQDISNNDPRRAKLIAEKGETYSSIDVACLNDIDTFMLTELGVLETVPAEAVPRTSEVLAILKNQTTIPHLYSVMAVLYNPAKVPAPPVSWIDLFNPAYAGRIGFSDVLYNFNIAAMNMGVGGQSDDFGPGRKALLDLKANDVRTFPSNEALGAALRAEEIWITFMWQARGFLWRRAGIPVAWSVPREGTFPLLFEAGVPRNARAKEAAWKYLDAMLDPKVQVAFSEKLGYMPTVRDAELPPDLAREIGMEEARRARLRPIDYEAMQRERGAMLEFWNKEFKG